MDGVKVQTSATGKWWFGWFVYYNRPTPADVDAVDFNLYTSAEVL